MHTKVGYCVPTFTSDFCRRSVDGSIKKRSKKVWVTGVERRESTARKGKVDEKQRDEPVETQTTKPDRGQ